MSVKDIIGKSRKEEIVAARQMFCYDARKQNKWKDWQIAKTIKRDRCSVIHSCAVVETMLEINEPKYKALAKRLGIV